MVEELYIEGLFMGHTHGALDLEHSVETSDIEVDQSLVPVRTVKVGETFSMGVALAEVSLEHIREVWGISAQIEDLGSGRRRLTFGGDTAIVEKPVMLVPLVRQVSGCNPPTGAGGRQDALLVPLVRQVSGCNKRVPSQRIGAKTTLVPLVRQVSGCNKPP